MWGMQETNAHGSSVKEQSAPSLQEHEISDEMVHLNNPKLFPPHSAKAATLPRRRLLEKRASTSLDEMDCASTALDATEVF